MKNKLKWLFLSTILISILISSCNQQKVHNLTIATAANMQFAMEELTTSFTKETGIKCETILSSSGKLTAQIKEGAPYDIFVSANMKYPNELYNAGFTTQKPKIYAFGKLVLWSMIDSIKPSINLLLHKNIKHIATANPKTAPYGIPTEEVLKHYKIYDSIKNKLVYGESIAQTNQFITTKAAEIGFTSKSVVLSPFIKGKGNWIDIDEQAYAPIKQGIVIIKNTSTSIDKKEKFYNFLFSKKGQDILNKFGYSTNF
ncbi:molybdate ABC transporter substrate-binding protein [Lutibacter flavus]|uniref:Molybdate transport system substrate-binding protein n=1 Tax=Lutibacter flavus TaxID=691689 RepID=A0A238Z7N5_9FLAO|nr:molybdate ABC transporter substrate-binding protein [Lutibacter flavus]SNR79230.1 molybdate transport system substrate-binding protein [Lutibacter flavus]